MQLIKCLLNIGLFLRTRYISHPKIISLLKSGDLYAESDGAEKDDKGAHVYGFINIKHERDIWKGFALTPVAPQEMSLLMIDHGGSVSILLIVYAIKINMRDQINPANYNVQIWIDNA